jgi:pyruvate,water dikinase
MVRSDVGASGVMFTIDPDNGCQNLIVINSIFGLGELIVQGKVIPDEFIVFKKAQFINLDVFNYKNSEDFFNKSLFPIISKKLGNKIRKIIYEQNGGIKEVDTTDEERKIFSLSDDEVSLLAKYGYLIEKHYLKAMDIEWAKDGIENKIYIVQARPETVHSTKQNIWYEYKLTSESIPILKGVAIGNQITSGKVRVIKNVNQIQEFQAGEILVTEMTDPDWEPIMKIAKGIITEKGGRTCHAAIVARELGIPAVVGVIGALEKLSTGDEVTIDNSQGLEGKIYQGILNYQTTEHKLQEIPEIKTKVYVNIGEPDEALEKWYLPVKGVGLAREEFIIASEIKIHPNALIDYNDLRKKLENYSDNNPINNDNKFDSNLDNSYEMENIKEIIEKIDELTEGYDKKDDYYVDKLAEGISKIAVAFYPKDVIVRFSDFKTNEYKNLIGGNIYEPKEENPMIGWRGASRYYHPNFIKAFKLEVLAIKKAREEKGLENIVVMVPFCRTPDEGKKVIEIIRSIIQDPKLKIYVMSEIPSNVLLSDEFLEIFDGMSIGSNDLTQLILGIDRDNEILSSIADERNKAVLKMIEEVIRKCKEKNKYVGICGQAPSDFPEIVEFLVKNKIDSISVNPDAVIKTIKLVKEVE